MKQNNFISVPPSDSPRPVSCAAGIPDPQPMGGMAGNRPWPKISIVSPSYNQGRFLEGTIRSVIEQGYPNLEYIVIDGGSTDESVDIIKRYEDHIDYWVSEKDRGQSHAINKGILHCTGEIFNWINSDDLLVPGALWAVAKAWQTAPGSIISGKTEFFNESGGYYTEGAANQTLKAFVRFWEAEGFAWSQQGTFLPLAALVKIDGVREDLRYSMDYNMMVRLLMDGLQVTYVDQLLARFRFHDASKTVSEVNEFRLQRVDMLRKMEGLPVRVREWEWNREQARRLADLARRELKMRHVRMAASFMARAILTSPLGTIQEVCEICSHVIRKMLPKIGAVTRLF